MKAKLRTIWPNKNEILIAGRCHVNCKATQKLSFLLSLFVLILCWSKPKLRTIWPSKIEILIAGVCHFYILQYSPIHGYGFNPFQCVAHEFKLRAQGSVAHAKVFHYVMGMWSVARTHNNFCFKEHSLEKGLSNYEMRDTRNFLYWYIVAKLFSNSNSDNILQLPWKKRNIITTTFFTIQCNLEFLVEA